MRALSAILCVVVVACGSGDSKPESIPEALRAEYGRTADDMLHGTNGLVIGETTLQLSEMSLTIKEGKVVGDDYQIGLAEVVWKKDVNKVPGKCKGTIARDGEHLLLRLFEVGTDKSCESILEGDWRAWHPVSEFPAEVRGWFGAKWSYSAANGYEIRATTIHDETGEQIFELKQGMAWEGREDEIIVVSDKDDELGCQGRITVKEDQLTSAMTAGETNAAGCGGLQGERWTVQAAKLPKAPLSNGRATIEVTDGVATITGVGKTPLVCTQKVLRTQPRMTTDRGRDGIPVLSGVVMALQPAKPTGGVAECAQAVARIDAASCQLRYGEFCDEEFIAAQLDNQDLIDPSCPTHIVVGDPEPDGHRVALLPLRDPINLACFEMIDRFKPAK